jgi:hypothetical protein
MTPKEKYDERKRLKAERLHQNEVNYAERRFDADRAEEQIESIMNSFERIADVLELWADQQSINKESSE